MEKPSKVCVKGTESARHEGSGGLRLVTCVPTHAPKPVIAPLRAFRPKREAVANAFLPAPGSSRGIYNALHPPSGDHHQEDPTHQTDQHGNPNH